jgi:hypothetical protein
LLSGFIHLGTILSFDDICLHPNIQEWLSTYQYFLKMCKSQDEEISLIGALCYGSLFIYWEDLLLRIVEHPSWVALNKDKEKLILIDVVMKSFRGSSYSVDMIFVRAECSKKDEARKVLQELYAGTPKVYPRGEMLLFIPVKSYLEEDYTASQRDKLIFNHNKYLGTEDCMAIFGFKDLNTMVTLKTGVKVTLCTLLKSIPGVPGMSRSRLFQIVDPISSHMCTLITFQQRDRINTDQQKDKLTNIIEAIIGHDQLQNIIQDTDKGIIFSGHDESTKTPKFAMASTVTYQGFLQENTTQTQSTQASPQSTTTITTTSQTVVSVIETRFQTI